jgi:hypothetical protein
VGFGLSSTEPPGSIIVVSVKLNIYNVSQERFTNLTKAWCHHSGKVNSRNNKCVLGCINSDVSNPRRVIKICYGSCVVWCE